MSLKSINESFKRMYESTLLPLNEVDEPISVKLKSRLTESVDSLQRKGNKNIESYETAFETILEEFFPGKSWYEVTNVDIFNDLFTGRDPYKTIRSICESIEPEKNNKNKKLTESSNPEDFIIENGILKKYVGSGGDVVIPDNITSIRPFAFEDCKSLKNITIPESVTKIGVEAFYGCKSLVEVIIEGTPQIAYNAFTNCPNLSEQSKQNISQITGKSVDNYKTNDDYNNTENYDDYEEENTKLSQSDIDSAIESLFDGDSDYYDEASSIIYNWYANEGVFDEYADYDELKDYLRSDINDMLNAADDKHEIDIVKKALVDDEEDFNESLTESTWAENEIKFTSATQQKLKKIMDAKLWDKMKDDIYTNSKTKEIITGIYSNMYRYTSAAYSNNSKEEINTARKELFKIINTWYAKANDSNNKIKESLTRILRRLNEDKISDEDKHDSDLIRSMLDKINKRSNARFTPEEQSVLDKYGIERNNDLKNLYVNNIAMDQNIDTQNDTKWDYDTHSYKSYSNGNRNKINYADRARKSHDRKNSDSNAHMNAHGRKSVLQANDRYMQDEPMRQKIQGMKSALWDRNFYKGIIDKSDDTYNQAVAKAKVDYEKAMAKAERDKESAQSGYTRKGFDRAQSRIDQMLKRDTSESLNENVNTVKSILTSLLTDDGKKLKSFNNKNPMPKGFKFKSSISGVNPNGELTYKGTDYAFRVKDGNIKVMTSAQAGNNWSETLLKEDFNDSEDFIIENGVLKSYKGPGGDVVIPNQVKLIGYGAFSNCTSLISVTISDSVTEIHAAAFADCRSLKSVTISDNVTWIPRDAFYNCKSLTSVKIGNSVREIGPHAFENCISLESITIPNSVRKITIQAFSNCKNLKDVIIFNNDIFIYSDSFEKCNSLSAKSKQLINSLLTNNSEFDDEFDDNDSIDINVEVPSPFDKYYKVADKEDFEDLGFNIEDYGVVNDAYQNYKDLTFLNYAVAKPEYSEYNIPLLLDIVEDSEGDIQLVEVTDREIDSVSIEEIEEEIYN